ncbi:conserved hypothetical protein [Nostocoides japonicum T1-X7]|uniref:Carboxypeptidase regulatory-like domain-containing protein n=1 Tax=Nostocoides japonicum T1-X7 TaxID=1194083 RepID=A0A077M177_9MICO|nr:hypothetical protein [Tetrasphaera japonica]CCH77955.1 conserved hypothetical protein [Tetrasphaera japonica T1-X7]
MTAHTDPIDDRDAAVLGQVRDLFERSDPMPADLPDRIRFALTVKALQAEVAEIIESASLATRGDVERTDSVTFTRGGLSLMVKHSASADGRAVRIDGWVTSGGARVDVVVAAETRTVVADARGRFVVDGIPRGRVHFIVWTDPDSPDERPVVTPSIDV